jgi:hypothetical protein
LKNGNEETKKKQKKGRQHARFTKGEMYKTNMAEIFIYSKG